MIYEIMEYLTSASPYVNFDPISPPLLGIVVNGTATVLMFFGLGDQLVVDERNKEGFRANESACVLAKAGEQTRNSKCLGLNHTYGPHS